MDYEFLFLYSWSVEGARVGAFMCYRCGAMIPTHPEIDTRELHLSWHENVEGGG